MSELELQDDFMNATASDMAAVYDLALPGGGIRCPVMGCGGAWSLSNQCWTCTGCSTRLSELTRPKGNPAGRALGMLVHNHIYRDDNPSLRVVFLDYAARRGYSFDDQGAFFPSV